MDGSEIDAVRALLNSKPRPLGWVQRRERLDEVGSIWPVADDVNFDLVDLDGVPGEWSIAPGGDTTRVCRSFMAAAIAPTSSSAIAGWSPRRAGRQEPGRWRWGASPGPRASLPRSHR